MRKIAASVILLLLAACGTYNYAPVPSHPEPLAIVHTPALAWMQDTLHLCASAHPKIALTVREVPVSALDLGAAHAILKLGPAPEEVLQDAHATLLGWESILIISSPEIPPGHLELPDLQILYTSLQPDYQAWSYPEGSEMSLIFNENILDGKTASPHLLIAPDPGAMLESVTMQPNTVGFIPQSWLDGDETINIIREGYPEGFRQPILALTNGEPSGLTVDFLKCLEELLP